MTKEKSMEKPTQRRLQQKYVSHIVIPGFLHILVRISRL